MNAVLRKTFPKVVNTSNDVITVGRRANPLFAGWYADPEVAIFDERYWVYPTYSDSYDRQTFFDCFSSSDLVNWTKHPRVLGTDGVHWATRAMWAPSVVKKGGRYWFFFSANDVHEGEIGGIGVAVSDTPSGPFKDYLGKPLIGSVYKGAQPIDQFVFQDEIGQWCILYGGWGRCVMAKLKDDFSDLVPWEDGEHVLEITPEGYVEGPVMFRRQGKWYFMWSEGNWTDSSYLVAYAVANQITGPWKRVGTAIKKNPKIASGAGHNSVLNVPGTDDWYIVYHRRPVGLTGANQRVTCIDKLEFDAGGAIKPVAMTHEGVEPHRVQLP